MARAPSANGTGAARRRRAARIRAVSSVGEKGLTMQSSAPASSARAMVLVAPVARDEDDGEVGEFRHGLHQLDPVGPGATA